MIVLVICRIIRVFCCYYGDIEQNKAGLKLYRLTANAILKKTIKCSPLTNRKISVTELSKMMHSDCSVLQLYPPKLSYMIENGIAFVVLSGTIIWTSGIPGIIAILLLGANFLFRYLFRKLMMSTEREINIKAKERIKFTIEVINIIKFIKANALESCYFNRLRELRIS